jgi:hypothetical protein
MTELKKGQEVLFQRKPYDKGLRKGTITNSLVASWDKNLVYYSIQTREKDTDGKSVIVIRTPEEIYLSIPAT